MRPYEPMLIDQPIYWARFGQHSLVDPLLPFASARDYTWRGCAVPDTSREQFAPRQTAEDQISIAPGSFLLMISAQSSAAPNDFQFSIEDTSSGSRLCSQDLRYMTGTGGPNGLEFPARPLPLILPSPWTVGAAGMITVRIVNLAAAQNNIRLFLQFAEAHR